MNYKKWIESAVPKAGVSHLVEMYLTWSGVGFAGALIASALDHYSAVPYAAYFTGAVNDAVGYRFWVLLSDIGLLFFCFSLPFLFMTRYFGAVEKVAYPLQRLTYTFFVVAFDEGALMIGILFANLLHASDKTVLLASKSFLFSDVGIFTILVLIVLNSALWMLGESIFNRDDKSFSGVVQMLMTAPVKYTAPGYCCFTGIAVYLIVSQ
ncbi:MAG: MxaP protein [Methylomicrobium sp.]|nr:MxaP protein [Methylomicrobium sp.]